MKALSEREALRIVSLAMNQVLSRRELISAGSTAYQGARQYDVVLGYPVALSASEYLARYQRQDIAARIVDLPAEDTWKNPPEITDGDLTESEFTKAWEHLVKRLRVWSAISRADRISGIGQYGVMFIGLKDGQPPEAEAAAGSLKSPEDVLFLRPFSEIQATIAETETDVQSPRFGQPTVYRLVTENTGQLTVHWTRCIHLADNRLDSDVYGVPRLQVVYNRLDDLMKIVGGTAEATWLNMRPGTVITTQEGYNWGDDSVSKQDVEAEIAEYIHGIARFLTLEGVNVTQLSGQVVDPTGPFKVIVGLISAASGIPQRVLLGSAAGELASAEEDTKQWFGAIASRQSAYAEPDILRPFIDRLTQLGALPAPASGDYVVEWPALFETSEADEAEVRNTNASAISSLRDPSTGRVPVTIKEQRVLLGLPAEVPDDMKGDPGLEPTPTPITGEPLTGPEMPLSIHALVVNDSVDQYSKSLRGVARGVWSGVYDYDQAWDALEAAIRVGLTRCWYEGLESVGIEPSEMSDEERDALRSLIVGENLEMDSFISYCEKHSKANKGKLADCIIKTELWAKRGLEAMNQARLMAKNDPKLAWHLGRTEKHCGTCSRLNGKVKRASYWRAMGIEPQSPPNSMLECEGWNCGCSLDPTDAPISKGKLPKVP